MQVPGGKKVVITGPDPQPVWEFCNNHASEHQTTYFGTQASHKQHHIYAQNNLWPG